MDKDTILQEVNYTTSTSGGPGGQHANKAETKVTIELDLEGSFAFAKAEKENLLRQLDNRLTSDGILQLSCSETRSQATNKEIVTDRLLQVLKSHIRPPKRRKKTKMPKWAKRKRLKEKRKHSEKKERRKPPEV